MEKITAEEFLQEEKRIYGTCEFNVIKCMEEYASLKVSEERERIKREFTGPSELYYTDVILKVVDGSYSKPCPSSNHSTKEKEIIEVSDGDNTYKIPERLKDFWERINTELSETLEYSDEWYDVCDRINEHFGQYQI